jgi:hypothetical protein
MIGNERRDPDMRKIQTSQRRAKERKRRCQLLWRRCYLQ